MITLTRVMWGLVVLIIVGGCMLWVERYTSEEAQQCVEQGGVWRGGWVEYRHWDPTTEDFVAEPNRFWEHTCWWKVNP